MDRQIKTLLEIGRADGVTWFDVTEYLTRVDVDLGNVDDVGTGAGADNPVRLCTFTLQNEGDMRFSPRDQTSPANILASAYSPLLWPNREVALSVGISSTLEDGQNLFVPVNTTGQFNDNGTYSGTFAENGSVFLNEGLYTGTYTKLIDLSAVKTVADSYLLWQASEDSFFYMWQDLERDGETVIGDSDDVVGDSEIDGVAFWSLLYNTDFQQETTITAEARVNASAWQTVTNGGVIPPLTAELDVSESTLDVKFTLDSTLPIFSPSLNAFDVWVESMDTENGYVWTTLFEGLLGSRINVEGNRVTCDAKDFAKILQDTYIEEVREYGSEGGVPAETVIQSIINDNLTNPPTLYTPVSPGFMISPEYEVEYQSVWDAIQDVARQIGWFLGYLEDAGEFKLTFMEPPRTKNTADFNVSWDDIIYLEELDISDEDIRNALTISYRDRNTGIRYTLLPGDFTELRDDTSIGEFGRRSMAIEEADTSFVNNEVGALRLGEAAISDLSDLLTETRIEMAIQPQTEFFTTMQVTNPLVSSTNDLYAVESVRHTLDFDTGRFRTNIIAAGKVIGSKLRWLRMQTRPGSSRPIDDERLNPDLKRPKNVNLIIAASDSSYEQRLGADYICDGVNDHVEIQAAIDNFPGVRAGVIQLTSGTFNASSPVILSANVMLVGEGGSTVVNFAGDGGFALSGHNSSLRSMALNKVGPTYSFAISLNNSEHAVIDDLEVNWAVGPVLIASTTSTRAKISNCIFRLINASISDLSCVYLWASSSTMSDCKIYSDVHGIKVEFCESTHVYGCNIESDTVGIETQQTLYLNISNNIVSKHTQVGIFIVGNENQVFGNKVYNGMAHACVIQGNRNLVNNNDFYTGGIILDAGTNTSFGAGNRLNDGTWST